MVARVRVSSAWRIGNPWSKRTVTTSPPPTGKACLCQPQEDLHLDCSFPPSPCTWGDQLWLFITILVPVSGSAGKPSCCSRPGLGAENLTPTLYVCAETGRRGLVPASWVAFQTPSLNLASLVGPLAPACLSLAPSRPLSSSLSLPEFSHCWLTVLIKLGRSFFLFLFFLDKDLVHMDPFWRSYTILREIVDWLIESNYWSFLGKYYLSWWFTDRWLVASLN